MPRASESVAFREAIKEYLSENLEITTLHRDGCLLIYLTLEGALVTRDIVDVAQIVWEKQREKFN